MLPSDAVKHMRFQHDRIRILIADVEALLAKPSPALKGQLERLAVAMREHNRDEEDYIPPFLEDLGKSGVLHTKTLMNEHVAEHAALVGGIEAAISAESVGLHEIDLVRRSIRALTQHMEREEQGFLNEDVIHDFLTTDGAGG